MRISTGYTAVFLAFFCSILASNTSAENTDSLYTDHSLTLYGKLKNDADFIYFEYVNPNDPNGGTYTFGFSNSFDSLNPYIILGNAPQNIGNLIYDTLMTALGTGPLIIGMASDIFNAQLGHNALRYAILTVVVVAYTWAAAHFFLAAKTLRRDLATAESSG